MVSKIEQKKYFSKNLSETIAKVSKVLGSAYVLSVCWLGIQWLDHMNIPAHHFSPAVPETSNPTT